MLFYVVSIYKRALLLKEIYWFAAFDTRKFPIIQLLYCWYVEGIEESEMERWKKNDDSNTCFNFHFFFFFNST